MTKNSFVAEETFKAFIKPFEVPTTKMCKDNISVNFFLVVRDRDGKGSPESFPLSWNLPKVFAGKLPC